VRANILVSIVVHHRSLSFVHMGRKLENLEFEIVLREGCEDEDLTMVEHALDDFDVERCGCHVAEDKRRMLNIVSSAFGSVSAFNLAVRDMLRGTRLRDDMAVRRVRTINDDRDYKDVERREDALCSYSEDTSFWAKFARCRSHSLGMLHSFGAKVSGLVQCGDKMRQQESANACFA